jgi:hypothetical protein
MIGYADNWYLYKIQNQVKDAELILQLALDNIERWTQSEQGTKDPVLKPLFSDRQTGLTFDSQIM